MGKRFSFAVAAAAMAAGALLAGVGSASAGSTWEAPPRNSLTGLPDVAVQSGSTWE